jgi:ATP-binding cassette, subfamily B, bacterial PglK
MQVLKKFLFLLSSADRKQASLLIIMIFIMALLDVIGVASILPFMAVLTNPNLIETNNFLNSIFQISALFGVKNVEQFLLVLGVLIFIILVVSLGFKSLTVYAQIRFVQMREYNISKRLIEGYLHQPYKWFLSQHSADIGKTILSEVNQIVMKGFVQLIELIARSMIAFAIVTLLILVDPKLAFIVGLSLGGSYGVIIFFTKKFLYKIGVERLKNNKSRFTVVIEAFNAVKEIKAGGLEQNYINNFSIHAKKYARNEASWQIIALLPRYLLEAIAFGGILLLILHIMLKTGSFNNALPFISLYVFAGYRLMPALQQIYISITSISFVRPSLDKLVEDLKNLKFYNTYQNNIALPFEREISLKNIFYDYPNSSRTTIKDVSINIQAKSTVGLVGETGSGKTTIVDIILGLLEPKEGILKVDGQIITKHNLKSWQQYIGYVPQNIYLSDDTIASNIAFGVDSKDINYEALKKAAKIANIKEFIEKELPIKYDTLIGERGVRLSGGQRQRIGVARALYHNPKVLIFDEATSALDNDTEKAVMEAVDFLNKDLTIILIAHRLNTLKNCDIIYKFKNGELVERGTPNEIIKINNN